MAATTTGEFQLGWIGPDIDSDIDPDGARRAGAGGCPITEPGGWAVGNEDR